MRTRLGDALVANTAVVENCSTDLVSADRGVDGAHDDPGNFGALRLTKEMHPRVGTLSLANGIAQVATLGAGFDQFRIAAGVSNSTILGDRSSGYAALQSARLFRDRN